ncbi:MAG TPA: HAD family hydrolase [Candidatus Coprenecus stercoravium]|uniref:phosphoglycolate phosphatase n=1 Tax=Candidatus Coprenecus stercoravium TaxID=2840735 RepID=A0A9D2K8W5_9BACT|nr:HAD family hydrolase [Candidatus Coprenecus stercoravium]
MKKLVIFDLDGTLLYTVPDIAAATNQALAACGYPVHSEAEIASYIGNGINKLFERALPEASRSQEEVLRIRSLFLPYYSEHCADMTRPFEGIPELLSDICLRGIKVAVASNKYHPATVKLMRHFFPEIPFCAVFGEREGVPRKPEPVIVRDILREAGISFPDPGLSSSLTVASPHTGSIQDTAGDERDGVLYVGDSGVDMQTAANAGIEAVAVTWGCRTRDELASYSPAHIVDHPSQIAEILF